MPSNFCKNVVCLFRVDPTMGSKELRKIFTSVKAAKFYRRRHFYKEVKSLGTTFSKLYPVEPWRVIHQGELYTSDCNIPEDRKINGAKKQ